MPDNYPRQATNRMRFAGRWYPAAAAAVDDRFAAGADAPRAPHLPAGMPAVAVLPHAGLAYSVRGHRAFWEALAPTAPPDRVVILAPSHYHRIPVDTVVGADVVAHETPYGAIPDAGVRGDETDRAVVEAEHAVELLLPGIARYLGGAVPVSALVVGSFSSVAATRAAAARVTASLSAHGRDHRRTLWLVSSDGTHYGPRFRWEPYGRRRWSELAARVRRDDLDLITAGLSGDLDRYWTRVTAESTVCGRWALALAAAIADVEPSGPPETGEGALTPAVIDYYASPEVVGDDGIEFVAYAVAAAWRGVYPVEDRDER